MSRFVGLLALISLAGTVVSFVLLVALHGLRPDLEPSWRMVSEYGYGKHGWVMSLCFIGLAVGCLGLAAAVIPRAKGVLGWLGIIFLIAGSLGLGMAAIYPSDPITTPMDQLSHNGQMHGTAAMIGIPSLPLAALLVSLSVSAGVAGTRRTTLLVLALLIVAALVMMLTVVMRADPQSGGFGPEVPIGWPNRLYMVAAYLWTGAAAVSMLAETGLPG